MKKDGGIRKKWGDSVRYEERSLAKATVLLLFSLNFTLNPMVASGVSETVHRVAVEIF